MADSTLPSRFVTQSEIESTNARREEAWKAAYARIGQEPPPKEVDETYDGRSLAEKLAANRAAKQEEYENSHKLSAQFRSLDPDEINFLDEVAVRRFEEEKRVKEKDEEELKGFRAAVQARDAAAPPLPGTSLSPTLPQSPSDSIPANSNPSGSSAGTAKPLPPTGSKPPPSHPTTKPKSIKPSLKGVVVVQRKRPKVAVAAEGEAKEEAISGEGKEDAMERGRRKEELSGEGKGGDRKRRRVE